MKYDLHLHTTASDGRLKPAELVKLARTKGLEIIAVTDHDTVSGIDEAIMEANNVPQVMLIPGVQINTDLPEGELHILGFFIDYKDAGLVHSLETISESRVGRAKKMVEKLHQLGMNVEWKRVLELARGESICRPHIAQAMLEKKYVSSEREAFDNYIGRNGPAYVERKKIKPVDAVKIVKKANGLPVLAHPADIQNLDAIMVELINAGLVGIEVYYGHYNQSTVNKLIKVAHKYKLVTTGGTDYHHFQDDMEAPLGSVDIPAASIEQLFTLAGKKIKVN